MANHQRVMGNHGRSRAERAVDIEEVAANTHFKLQPADPFDLIRWLARTQSDPRKAVAELVQNSIDARGARRAQFTAAEGVRGLSALAARA